MKILLLLFLISGFVLSQDTHRSNIENLLKRCSIETQMVFLSRTIYDIATEALQRKGLVLQEHSRNTFADSSYADLLNYACAFFSSAEVDTLSRLYHTSTFMALAKVDAEMEAPDSSDFASYLLSLSASPAFLKRSNAANHFLNENEVSNLEKAGAYAMLINITSIMNFLRPKSKRYSESQIDSIVVEQVSLHQLSENRVNHFLYQYRTLTDDELNEFVAFYDSKLGKKYLEFQIQTIKRTSHNITKSIIKQLQSSGLD